MPELYESSRNVLEPKLKSLLEEKYPNCKCALSTIAEDSRQHWDVSMTNNSETLYIDVKTRTPKYNNTWSITLDTGIFNSDTTKTTHFAFFDNLKNVFFIVDYNKVKNNLNNFKKFTKFVVIPQDFVEANTIFTI